MIDTSNAQVDVDVLMGRLREKVTALRDVANGNAGGSALSLRNGVFLNSIEALVNLADQRSQVRTHWPSSLGGAVFGNRFVRDAALGGLAFLFKDQRNVNQALISAFRESIALNRHMMDQVDALRLEVEALKRDQRER